MCKTVSEAYLIFGFSHTDHCQEQTTAGFDTLYFDAS